MSFRRSAVVIIDCGRNVIRAGRGVGEELLPAPSIEIPARVGRRKDAMQIDSVSQPSLKWSDYLVGTALDEAEATGDNLDISWPFADAQINAWAQVEAIWRYILFTALQLRRTQNEYPLLLSLPPNLARVAYERITQTCFEQLNVTALAIFDRPLLQIYAANAISGLVVDISRQNTDISPVYDSEICRYGVTSVPVGLHDCELYLAHTFRRNPAIITTLNSPDQLTPSDLDAALISLVRQAWADGIIQVPLVEGSAPPAPTEEENAGVEDIAAVLVAGKEKALIEAAAKKKTTAQEKKAAATAAEKERVALDLVDVEFNFTPSVAGAEELAFTVTVGRERHQFFEPLFDPTLMLRLGNALSEEHRRRILEKPVGLPEAVRTAMSLVESYQRSHIWEGVLLTGDSSVKHLETALHSRLTPYLVKDPENQTQTQATNIRLLKLPEYFAEYRDLGTQIASFLGASIIAKMTFTETSSSKAFITKNDYSEKGPASIRDILL